MDRFKGSIQQSFEEHIELGNIDNSHLGIFAYEFALVSGNTSLIDCLNGEMVETEYTFLLKNYANLFEREKYLEALSAFINRFGPAMTTETYKSLFNQKIFFTSDRFNWLTCYLSVYLGKFDLSSLYNDLISAKVKIEHIISSIRSSGLSMDPNFLEVTLQAQDVTKRKELKRIVRAIENKHFKTTARTHNKAYFYDRLFLDPRKRRT